MSNRRYFVNFMHKFYAGRGDRYFSEHLDSVRKLRLILRCSLCSTLQPRSPHYTSRLVSEADCTRRPDDHFLEMAKHTPNCVYRIYIYSVSDHTIFAHSVLTDPIADTAIWGTAFPEIDNAPSISSYLSKWPTIVLSHGVG